MRRADLQLLKILFGDGGRELFCVGDGWWLGRQNEFDFFECIFF